MIKKFNQKYFFIFKKIFYVCMTKIKKVKNINDENVLRDISRNVRNTFTSSDMILICYNNLIYRFASQMRSESRLVTTRREMGHANFATMQSSRNHYQEVHVRAPTSWGHSARTKFRLGSDMLAWSDQVTLSARQRLYRKKQIQKQKKKNQKD